MGEKHQFLQRVRIVDPAAQVDQQDQAARLMRVVLATQVHLVDQVIKLLDLQTLLKKFLMEMRNQREDDLGEVLKMQVVDADSKCRFNESYDGTDSKNICILWCEMTRDTARGFYI